MTSKSELKRIACLNPSRMAERVHQLEKDNAALKARIDSAPVAIMDTRDVLGICAPTEDAFDALYALQGHRVRLVIDEVVK